MSQPAQSTPFDVQLQELRDAGAPVFKGNRNVGSEHEATNRRILARWLPHWYRQAAENLAALTPAAGLPVLTMIARGLPALVVGIGPSLDDEGTLQVLRDAVAQRRAVLIATDAALRPLAARGVRPDLVISFDCGAHQATLFEGVDTSGLTLLVNTCTHPSTLAAWRGAVIAFNMDHHGLELTDACLPALYPGKGTIPNVGTVGNEAVLVAWIMGCGQILTVGMDLCYQNQEAGFRYRCSDFQRLFDPGQPEGYWVPVENKLLYDNDLRAKDTYPKPLKGGTFTVDPELELYHDVLVRAIGKWDLPVTDLSTGGSLAGYVRQLPPRQALDELCGRAIHPFESAVFHLHQLLTGGAR